MEYSCPCECLGLPSFLEASSSCLGPLAHSVVLLHLSPGINHVYVSFPITLSLVFLVLAVGDTPFLRFD
jgi:hypothetical protein